MSPTIKQIIAGLVVLGAVSGGTFIYLGQSGPRPLTYEEYLEIISTYNEQITYILQNCDTDTRCVIVKGSPRANFGSLKSRTDIVKRLNEWVGNGNAAYVR